MSAPKNKNNVGDKGQVVGALAEFETPQELLENAAKMRDAGYTKWDVHSPFPVHGMDEAMGMGKSPMQYLTILCGFVGAGCGLLLQWWMNAFDYKFLVSGKPYFSLPANIPVTFEATVLCAAIGTVVGLLAMNGLPRFVHPAFKSERFKRATADRFFISVEAADPKFDEEKTLRFLQSMGGSHVEKLEA